MSEAKFKVGDLVEIISENGLEGAVSDIVYSYRYKCNLFVVTLREDDVPYGTYPASDLKLIPEKKDYSMTIQIDIAQNVVIASLYEVVDPNMRPVAKGHGHIIHEGELGIAQAASYACKRLYESLGGTLTKGGSWR